MPSLILVINAATPNKLKAELDKKLVEFNELVIKENLIIIKRKVRYFKNLNEQPKQPYL